MTKDKQEKINILIKFLKRKPKEGKSINIRGLVFDNEDILHKYRALDKHIKLVAECLEKHIISYDFFKKFERIRVRKYDDESKLKLFVLFSNSAKMKIFSTYVQLHVGMLFFGNFDFIGKNGKEVDINNKEIVKSPFVMKSETYTMEFGSG